MPKRPIHLQPPDNSCRRIRRDLDFLRDYWNRLLAPNQSCDIRLPELLRANHLMRHLSALPSNHGMRVNVSFTILNDSDCLESEDVYNETYPIEPNNSGFYRSPCAANTTGYNNFLRNYTNQLSENYAAIERELIRARLLASLIERDRLARCQNAFYNQRAAACNWNKFPVGGQTSSARMFSGLQERHVNSREKSNRQAHPSFRNKCCIPDKTNNDCSINQQSARQKENPERFNDLPKNVEQHWSQKLPQNSCSRATVRKLQSDNNAPQNRAETTLDRNGEATIQQRRSKESMEACQGVSKTVNDTTKISHSVDSSDVGGGVAINKKSDKRSAQPISCQRNVLQFVEPSDVATDQSRRVEEEHGIKRKLNNLEDQAIEIDQGTSSQPDGSNANDRIKSHFKDVPTIFSLDEKAARSRIRNSRIPIEERPYSKRRVSSPKYASLLRMLRKEADQRLRDNSSSRRDKAEKSQQRRGLPAESTGYDNLISSAGYGNRAIHDDPQIERRTPTPRSTVHTTYNPVMHSSATDPISDSSGLTIQLLRLAVLLYAPVLMPALNSLIAQQNQQAPVSSAFEGSNDLLTQIFRLLDEQQSIPNLPFVSIESERVSSALAAETNAGSSRTRSEENKGNTSIAKEESGASRQESISVGTSGWKSNNLAQQQNGKNRNWQLTSMLTDSDVRLDRNIFTAEDFRKFAEFLGAEKQRPEDVRSLSTRSKNEIVMKEYFRNWLHRLLQQLNAASSNWPSNDEELEYSEGSSKATGESPLEKVEKQENANRSTSNDSSDSSKNDRNIFTEHEEEDSDDQRSLTSATSTSSSQSLQLKQDDATVVKKEEPRNENSQD